MVLKSVFNSKPFVVLCPNTQLKYGEGLYQENNVTRHYWSKPLWL